MIGIGHRQQKYTKIKILAQKSKEHNQRYDQLLSQGIQPEQALRTLEEQEYARRHQQGYVQEPYKTSQRINQIGGAIHLGYTQAHKTLTDTQGLYAPMNSVMQAKKSGTQSSFKVTKTPQQHQVLTKLKQRIQKDHLQQDAKIDLGQKIESDYKRNFKEDDKMKQMRQQKDKQFNQRKNDLKWYAETYIKTKDSLRKC